MIYYMLNIVLKFPEKESNSLVQDIKKTTYEGLKNIIYAQKEYNRKARLSYLSQLDAHLKMLKVFIRIAHKKKYITSKNYLAWSKKIANISNLMAGWIRACLVV